MEVQQNMANVIRMIMETRNMSMDDFSEELEISRSTLQEYLKGKGNPSIKPSSICRRSWRLSPLSF